jgi:hypothetical protein
MTALRSKPPPVGLAPVRAPAIEVAQDAIQEYLDGLGEEPVDEALEAEDIARTDPASESRILYTGSIRRLRQFVLAAPADSKMAEAQAKVAFGCMKHFENRGLKELQLGRAKKDEEVAAEVLRLRDDLRKTIEIKADRKAEERLTAIDAQEVRQEATG